ncbi:MAG TPA: four helix bundle protein [Pyrinomonadaceae bacterium]|jgi:four helix bundle protein|nr:four helix bundle protein [Pyrinomonadaceae bacterium]
MPTSPGFRGLRVYQLAFKLAMEIYQESKKFPPEERYSLTDQIRRASRSVASNIGEGYRKKQYPKMFVSKMSDDGEAAETQVWIDFAQACGYISESLQRQWTSGYEEIGRMLGGMIAHPEKFSHLTETAKRASVKE